MKILYVGSFPHAWPVYNHLCELDLQAVFVIREYCPEDLQLSLEVSFKQNNIEGVFTTKQQFNFDLKKYLLEYPVDLCIVNGCPIKIKTEVLQLPKHGFINIHFGKLPQNRGADPVFWTIREMNKTTAVTIHKMDESFDTGAIVSEDSVEVQMGETSGMLNSKLVLQSVNTLRKALKIVQYSEKHRIQDQLHLYKSKPMKSDLTIDWEKHTAQDIEALVNASNPKYVGATTYFQGSEVKIIEVSPVDHAPMIGEKGGKIVHTNPQEGIFVCCKYGQLLRINIMNTDAGILTGNKYASLGIRTGQLFTTTLQTEHLQIKY